MRRDCKQTGTLCLVYGYIILYDNLHHSSLRLFPRGITSLTSIADCQELGSMWINSNLLQLVLSCYCIYRRHCKCFPSHLRCSSHLTNVLFIIFRILLVKSVCGMFCKCKQLDHKHASDLPIVVITVRRHQDSTRDTSNMQHTKYFCF